MTLTGMCSTRLLTAIAAFVLGGGLAGCGGDASSGEASGAGGSAGASNGSGGVAAGGSGAGEGACVVGGTSYEVGESFPSEDGCNSCTCLEGGGAACTRMACPEETRCGGWAGNTCTEDEYCAYEPGAQCGAADASSVCRPRPQACDLAHSPVCACNGQTYGNACAANADGHGVASEGECS